MLFIISFVIALAIFICTYRWATRRFAPGIEIMSMFFICIFSIALLTSVAWAIDANACIDARIAENEARYEMLMYQLENDIYDNDNDIGKRELMVDIQKWNSDLAWYKEVQDDFWLGIFYPNIYDQLEFIPLN